MIFNFTTQGGRYGATRVDGSRAAGGAGRNGGSPEPSAQPGREDRTLTAADARDAARARCPQGPTASGCHSSQKAPGRKYAATANGTGAAYRANPEPAGAGQGRR